MNNAKIGQETSGLVSLSNPTPYKGSKARFRVFPKLPAELRLLIWNFAVPDPRDIDGVMLYLTNFDLSNPKAIIPTPREMKNFCAGTSLRAKSTRIWWAEMCASWQYVLSLLHSCHDARSATLKKFRLSYDSTIEGEDQALWCDNDTIYFPSSGGPRYGSVLTSWLGVLEGWDKKISLPGPHFSSLKHLALDFMPEFQMSPDAVNEVLDLWLKKFPSLESFTLLFDPEKFGRKERLVLFEAGDGPLTESYREGRGEIVKRISGYQEKDIVTKAGLKLFENGPPRVDCTVLIGLKKRRAKAARAPRGWWD